jgi:SAM-dependent methyltransferase
MNSETFAINKNAPPIEASSEGIQKIREPRILYKRCPLCENAQISLVKIGNCSRHPLYNPTIPDKIKWTRCESCNHVFTDGFFSEEALRVIFNKSHANQQPGANFEKQRHVSAKIVEKVARYAKIGPWLDVGFGNGSLLFTADEWGFKPIGLDLRPSTVAIMRRLGFEAYCEQLEKFESDTTMSVISLADVLEHMPFPKSGLLAAYRLLEPGGILFLSMPNYNCPAWRFLDLNKSNPYWGELEHYHNFSRERLYYLLQETNFMPLCYGISERYRVCMEVIARKQ